MANSSQGFSLLEVAISLSLFIIITGIAITNMQTLTTSTINKSTLQNVISLLETTQLAVHDTHTSAAINQYKNNLAAFFDINSNGNFSEDTQLISNITLPKHTSIHWRTFPIYRSYLHISPDYTDNGTIWLCNKDKPAWAIAINKQGRINQVGTTGLTCETRSLLNN